MPGKARETYLYSRIDLTPGYSRGQRRGITRCDMRTLEGRFLKAIRKQITEHLASAGVEPTILQRSLIERASWLELRCALYDRKELEGKFTALDQKYYLALVGQLRRLYRDLGIQQPQPSFAKLLKSRPEAVA